MSELPAIWIVAGFLAWLWIMVRNNMVDDGPSLFVAILMIFPAVVGGPLTWVAVAVSEYDGPIK